MSSVREAAEDSSDGLAVVGVLGCGVEATVGDGLDAEVDSDGEASTGLVGGGGGGGLGSERWMS